MESVRKGPPAPRIRKAVKPPSEKKAKRGRAENTNDGYDVSDSSDENYIQKKLTKLREEISDLEATLVDAPVASVVDAVEEDPAANPEDYEMYEAPEFCVPIRADVRTFDWGALAKACRFDVICMDPPWLLSSAAPTRGVAIGYSQLANKFIEDIPVHTLSDAGLIFIWVINKQFAWTVEALARWGYTYIDEIAWVKRTCNRRLAKGHGYYLQHSKETCVVGRKGDIPMAALGVASDVINAERRGQSQKPTELYEIIEKIIPNGKYLEIFARKNNLRDYWVSIGNEL